MIIKSPSLTEHRPDKLYAEHRDQVGDFVFDATVADVFPDMIQRSVPGYAAIINNIGLLTAQYAKSGTYLYDLGCSLGAASLAMASGLAESACTLVGVDNAPAMLEKARDYTRHAQVPIQLVEADVSQIALQPSSVVVMNFTLQFVPKARRDALLEKIAAALVPGGIFILSEKISGETEGADQVLVNMHHAFKRAQGYSDLEISQKRSALENVLVPETVSQHKERFARAGFTQVDVWFQCFNFVSFVARK